MTFHSARCEVCREYVFKEEQLVAFRLKVVEGREVVRIDLKGEEPWSGIRVICKPCVRAIASWAGS